MKKGISILMVFLMLTAMVHISVAKHYCGGELAASKISLSGGLASCGMEGTEDSCPRDSSCNHFQSHCCDDVITFYSIDNNYNQSQAAINKTYRHSEQVLEIPFSLPVQFNIFNSPVYTDVSPPAYIMYTAVDLSRLCILRI